MFKFSVVPTSCLWLDALKRVDGWQVAVTLLCDKCWSVLHRRERVPRLLELLILQVGCIQARWLLNGTRKVLATNGCCYEGRPGRNGVHCSC